MARDKKGKGKVVAKPSRKRTREECEWDRVLAVPDKQGQPQRPVRIREPQAEGQGETGSATGQSEPALATVAVQGTLRCAAQGVLSLQ